MAEEPRTLRPGVRDSRRSGDAWIGAAIVALTLLAPALGGSTTLWAQAFLALGTGLLFVLAPPRRSLGWIANSAFVALLLLALAACLPAAWFGDNEFRVALTKLGVQLPSTRTLQPWITLESVLLLFLGLTWSYGLLAYDWGRERRRRAWLIYALGILALSVTLIVAAVAKTRVPLWPDVREFGFFPNRNQTSNVLGLGGVMIYALGLQQFQENKRYWWLWFASLSVICWALILNYSRAGILLFFCGALAVHIYWWSTSRDRRRSLIAFGGLILLVVLFVVDGGATFTRFGLAETRSFFLPAENLRLGIYRDAFALAAKFPLLGVGLGNFRPLFAIDRSYSLVQKENLHPESDWLWAATELGWLAPLLLLILIIWWIKRCRPFETGTFRILRIAAMICVCGFAVHGLLDVSGHRIGALWPALFLASTAIYPDRNFVPSVWLPRIFRIIGLSLVAIGTWWFVSICGVRTAPTTATLQRLESQIEAALARRDFPAVAEPATEALHIEPLDWALYFQRGAADAALHHSHAGAVRDFAVARYLLPYWPELCLQEGGVWLGVGEVDLAFDAWREALRRSSEKAPDIYARIYEFIKTDSELRDRWRELGRENKNCLLVFFRSAGPVEFAVELERLLAQDPGLNSLDEKQKAALFSVWYQTGDKLALAQALREKPDWEKIGWRRLAQVYADYQDYRQAYETGARHITRPSMPEQDPKESVESLALRFKAGGNPQDGLILALAQANRGQLDEALAVLNVLSSDPRAPRSVYFLESDLWARKGEWQKAWQALSRDINSY